MVEFDDIIWGNLGRMGDAQFYSERLERAITANPRVTKITVCGKTPMKAQLLVQPLASAVVTHGLAGLLRYCRSENIRVELFRPADNDATVRAVVHWRCCYREVPR